MLASRICWMLVTAIGIMSMVVTPAAAQDGFSDPSLLISTEQLERALDDLNLRILDVRSPDLYQEGHIPFALSLPMAALLDESSRIEGARRSDAELVQMFSSLGIGRESRVVLYDDKGGHAAARILWILRYFGQQDVSVLDGGFPKWEDEGNQVTQQTRLVTQMHFPLDLTPRRLATADWILGHLDDPDIIIVDVRPAERYIENHIPGAVNIPWQMNLAEDETWADVESLLELYESNGVTKDKEIVVYCQGGNHNAHSYLTLSALGYPLVRSYDRAWPEWGSDPNLPKVAGDSPGALMASNGDDETATSDSSSISGGDGDDFNWELIVGPIVAAFMLLTGGAVILRMSRRQPPSV